MKKNFLKVAALLIAAMLLVVSCSQEVAPKNEDDGLVNVTLNTSVASKGLTFDGLDSLTSLTYKYYLEALWDESKVDEAVVGETGDEGKSFDGNSGFNLGHLSQGYWKVRVEALKGSKVVLSGETNQYITEGNATVTVFLNVAGTSNSSCTLSFDINVNNLAAENAGYKLYYSIEGTKYDGKDFTVSETEIVDRAQVSSAAGTTNPPAEGETNLTAEGTTNPTYVTKFTGSESGLKPGYYRVTVTLKKDSKVIGGITRGFLLIDGDEKVTLKGSVSASDFVKSTLNVITAKVSISDVTAKVGSGSNLLTTTVGDLTKGTLTCADNSNKATVVYSLTPTLNIEKNKNGVTDVSGPTYSWRVDGEEKSTSPTLTIEYTPGNRYVTCIVTYTYKYKVGESEGQFAVSAEAYTYLQVNEYVAPSNAPSNQ